MAERPWHGLVFAHETKKFLPGKKSKSDGRLPTAAIAGLK
jgi:hypothetical protein